MPRMTGNLSCGVPYCLHYSNLNPQTVDGDRRKLFEKVISNGKVEWREVKDEKLAAEGEMWKEREDFFVYRLPPKPIAHAREAGLVYELKIEVPRSADAESRSGHEEEAGMNDSSLEDGPGRFVIHVYRKKRKLRSDSVR
mmetsp:Transcript_22218/g.57217  ORF Transcript_22218/g.57217 Transcript_22218/m.57217 type:complete len:140 (-) Transcript_22218:582-1001(-)